MKIGHQDRRADANGRMRGDRGEDDHLTAITNIVVDPDLFKSLVRGQAR
jgi:hypothetical protein